MVAILRSTTVSPLCHRMSACGHGGRGFEIGNGHILLSKASLAMSDTAYIYKRTTWKLCVQSVELQSYLSAGVWLAG